MKQSMAVVAKELAAQAQGSAMVILRLTSAGGSPLITQATLVMPFEAAKNYDVGQVVPLFFDVDPQDEPVPQDKP